MAHSDPSSGTPDNPFAAPQTDAPPGPQAAQPHYGDASLGQRFANVVLDYFGVMMFAAVIGFVSAVVVGPDALDEIPDQLFGIGAMTAYYVLLEGLTGRTLGKLVTRTRVIGEDDEKPTWPRILGRSLARFVPFEMFSFLGGDEPRGWHDRWSRTRVVRLQPRPWEKVV